MVTRKKTKVRVRKRPTPKVRPNKPDRIAYIVKKMGHNEWTTGQSTLDLAKKWKMSVPELGREVAEASRQIKALVAQDPDLLDRIRVGLDWSAKTAKAIADAHPNTKLAINALRAYNESLRVLTAAQSKAQALEEARQGEPQAFGGKTDEELADELSRKS